MQRRLLWLACGLWLLAAAGCLDKVSRRGGSGGGGGGTAAEGEGERPAEGEGEGPAEGEGEGPAEGEGEGPTEGEGEGPGEGEGEGDPPDGPRIVVTPPAQVLFEDVQAPERATRAVVVRNAGSADLQIAGVELINTADGDFSLDFAATSPHQSLPAVLTPGDEGDRLELAVTFAPVRAGPAGGQLLIHSNDPERPEVGLDLLARSIFPCVEVSPLDLDFGAVLIDTAEDATVDVANCGDVVLVVESMELAVGTAADFSIAAPLAGLDRGCVGAAGACRGEAVLAPGQTRSFIVRYAPSGDGADGGRGVLHTDVPGGETVEVNLFGRGSAVARPLCVAEGRVPGGAWGPVVEAAPLQTVELRGTGSEAADGEIALYDWRVVARPADSISDFAPHAGAPEVTFFLDLAGQYVFELVVVDRFDLTTSCNVQVTADVDRDLHVELVWDTPADPDQTDTGFGAGSDADLHVLRSPGRWFCEPEDCYYAVPRPDWGVAGDQSDNPSMVIDDTDGAGPEVILLDRPEDGATYRVAVHYFNDHGYGQSFATLRIRIRGELVFEQPNKLLPATDYWWEVAEIAWPAGAVTPIDVVLASPSNDACQ